MSTARRQQHVAYQQRRQAEASARCQTVDACRRLQAENVPTACLLRRLALADRTVRRWRKQPPPEAPLPRGRRPQWAEREDRNQVIDFLRRSGAGTPTVAVWAEFPQIPQADLTELARRYRRCVRRRAERWQCQLEWRLPGTVWAADFKERREPLEGQYGWLLSIKDLASGYQLAWQPLVQATAEVVQAVYAALFAQHGRPLVLKTDNGGPFRADEIKHFLAEQDVIPLFSPKRRPQYNGGVERANGQLAGYQEALAQLHHRPAGPTREDAAGARRIANELAHPHGWRGPTAAELWVARPPISEADRQAFLAAVAVERAKVLAHWELPPETPLTHDASAARDRRAVRDVLLAQDLLRLHPRRGRNKNFVPNCRGAGILMPASLAAVPIVGTAPVAAPHFVAGDLHLSEEVHSSTQKIAASGHN